MTIIGIWMAIVGYGIAYSGMIQLGGGKCSLIDGFRGKCAAGTGRPQVATSSASGITQLGAAQANQSQQAGVIGTTPIPQVTL